MTREDWDYLLEERVAIMREVCTTDSEAHEKAWFDVVANFGQRPKKVFAKA